PQRAISAQEPDRSNQRYQERGARDKDLRAQRAEQQLNRSERDQRQTPVVQDRLLAAELRAALPGDETRHHRHEKAVTHVLIGSPLARQSEQNRSIAGNQQRSEPGDGGPG